MIEVPLAPSWLLPEAGWLNWSTLERPVKRFIAKKKMITSRDHSAK
jgi:hypothetical protein